jgi:hypothetical protein
MISKIVKGMFDILVNAAPRDNISIDAWAGSLAKLTQRRLFAAYGSEVMGKPSKSHEVQAEAESAYHQTHLQHTSRDSVHPIETINMSGRR